MRVDWFSAQSMRDGDWNSKTILEGGCTTMYRYEHTMSNFDRCCDVKLTLKDNEYLFKRKNKGHD